MRAASCPVASIHHRELSHAGPTTQAHYGSQPAWRICPCKMLPSAYCFHGKHLLGPQDMSEPSSVSLASGIVDVAITELLQQAQQPPTSESDALPTSPAAHSLSTGSLHPPPLLPQSRSVPVITPARQLMHAGPEGIRQRLGRGSTSASPAARQHDGGPSSSGSGPAAPQQSRAGLEHRRLSATGARRVSQRWGPPEQSNLFNRAAKRPAPARNRRPAGASGLQMQVSMITA